MTLQRTPMQYSKHTEIGMVSFYFSFLIITFVDSVKRWITFNEPWSFVQSGYGTGNNPPARYTLSINC